MNSPVVRIERSGFVSRIVLNRPEKRNALTRELIAQLSQAIDTIKVENTARFVVLAAEGPVFCAGMDLNEMEARAGQADAEALWQEDSFAYRDLLMKLFTLRMPTIAVLQGPALAGGVGIMLACDLVLMQEEAWISLPEPQRGITAAVVSPLLLYRIGVGAAMPLLLASQRCSAERAYQMGLCHQICASSAELAEVEQTWKEQILSNAPGALARTKKVVRQLAANTLVDQLDLGVSESAAARATEEAREGLAAFLEKRNPTWKT